MQYGDFVFELGRLGREEPELRQVAILVLLGVEISQLRYNQKIQKVKLV